VPADRHAALSAARLDQRPGPLPTRSLSLTIRLDWTVLVATGGSAYSVFVVV
jgi:hypothetical protein